MRAFVVLLLLGSALLSPAGAQDTDSSNEASTEKVVYADKDYRIGPNDRVEVYILRMPELSREYPVGAEGTIDLPFLGSIPAQKKTSQELAKLIADGLRGDYLVDPQVSVVVKQTIVTYRFFIQGAVRTPGVFTLLARPSLIELITIAGGLNPTYGATAFIIHSVRPTATEAQELTAGYELRKANINALMRGEFDENVSIEPGDIVHIPQADVYFVAGEVKAPGSFPLKEATTLRQAISLAQGASSTASPGKAVIFREDKGGQKREIPVDVGAVMRGKQPDIAILANDIIVVPSSKVKSTYLPIINSFGLNAAVRLIP